MTRRGVTLGWAHVRAARFRRAARGRATWLADDLTSGDHRGGDDDRDELPPLDRLPRLDTDRSGPEPRTKLASTRAFMNLRRARR